MSSNGFATLNLGLGNPPEDSEENLQENYRRFCGELEIDEARILTSIQVHSDRILCVNQGEDGDVFVSGVVGRPGVVKGFGADTNKDDILPLGWRNASFELDGFISNMKNLPLMVRFADCQGVLMFDPVKKVIAAVHCGWRGNVQNILGKAVKKMLVNFGCDAKNILVGISPSLGPCCAEFTDPSNELPEWMQKYIGEKKACGSCKNNDDVSVKNNFVDLWQCSLDQLTEAGVLPENIENMRRCTVCENETFFSYRVGGAKSGRMGGVVELR